LFKSLIKIPFILLKVHLCYIKITIHIVIGKLPQHLNSFICDTRCSSAIHSWVLLNKSFRFILCGLWLFLLLLQYRYNHKVIRYLIFCNLVDFLVEGTSNLSIHLFSWEFTIFIHEIHAFFAKSVTTRDTHRFFICLVEIIKANATFN